MQTDLKRSAFGHIAALDVCDGTSAVGESQSVPQCGKARIYELRGGRITIKARKPNEDQVEIVFTDDGKGMSETVKHHAFDPFFTTGRNQGGTGLGLHIVHNIVTQQ